MDDYLGKAKELIDKLSFEVVMLEPQDVHGFGVVLNLLDEIIGVFEGAGEEGFAGLGRAMKSIAEKLVLGEAFSVDEGISKIEQGASLFQEALRDLESGGIPSEKIAGFCSECGISRGRDAEAGEQAEGHEDGRAEGVVRADFGQDRELTEGFVLESLEHLETIEINVLALEQNPEDREVLDAIFRPFHTVKGVSGFLNLSDINHLAHEVETLLDDARNGKVTVDEAVTDAVLDSVDLMRRMIGRLRQELETGAAGPADFGLEAFVDRLRALQISAHGQKVEEGRPDPRDDGADTGTILVEKGIVTDQDVSEALVKQAQLPGPGKKIGEILVEDRKATAKDVVGALRDQKRRRGAAGGAEGQIDSARFVRVDTHKLDNMVDMVGELVITQAMLGQDMAGLLSHDQRLYSNLGQLRRITSEIQRISMSMRMVPIKQTFEKMIRLVRDLSKKSGKQVKLNMVGEETEIDRNMVDEIYDPLVHMVRNSLDHGIEMPLVRKAAGKPETGTVTLMAYHRGGNIVIEVSDDGKGLDRDKIVERAIERGLIRSGENTTDQEIFALIFQPGFSTAEEVTDVSGRGVGMDVVKRAVDSMRGRLDVKSERNKGTTILLKLPLTLAIIDGISVCAGGKNYIIPTTAVVESLRPAREDCSSVVDRGEMVKIRDTLYPLIRLHSLFGFEPLYRDPWEAIVVVAESDGRRKCILVDELVGKQEVVIKSLGEQLKGVKGMAGGAILADGRVGLILDIPGLFQISESC